MQISEFIRRFERPDPRFSPAPIWWWSGERLEINRLRWQMDQLLAMGIFNVVILNLAPSGPLFGSEADDPAFLSEPWWEIFEQVCDHAREIGMFIWFYDQIGFSGANFQAEIVAANPEFSAQKLKIISVEGSGKLSVECPSAATPIAAYAVDSHGVKYLPIQDRAVSVMVSGEAKLSLVYTLRQGYDYFSHPACEKLLNTVHREFERRLPNHLGKTIIGSFQDELPDLPTWGSTFGETFEKQFGYRLEEVIHRLFEPGDSDSRRTRLHYHQHRANLAEEALFKLFFRWHESHGLQCGFDQQSPAREARVLGAVQKYADYIQTHRWYAAPGSDLHGNGKLHSSIAWMYDRPRVWIEGFHSTGWGGTIADTLDWLLPYLRAGANLYNPHAVYYSTRMGWWDWAPPSTCWRQPYARHYRGFAEMIARLTKVLSQGVHQAEVGVIFPTATVQSEMGPEKHFHAAAEADQILHQIIGSMRWHQAKVGVLDEMSLDFHLLDEETIQSGEVGKKTSNIQHRTSNIEGKESGGMLVKGVALRTIILPGVTMLQERTIARLKEFAEGGGRIVAVGSSKIESPGGDVIEIDKLPNAIVVASPEELAEVLKDGPRLIHAPVPTMHRRVDDLHILFVPAVAGMATQVKWPGWFSPMERTTIDPGRYLQWADIKLPAGVSSVWRFDPITGETETLSTHAVTNESHLALDFKGAPFAVLIWSDGQNSGVGVSPARSRIELQMLGRDAQATTESLALSQNWWCEYLPSLPTEFADIYDPSEPWQRLPHTAEFQYCRDEGDAGWSRGIPKSASIENVRATFGVHGFAAIEGEATDRPIVFSPQFGIAQDEIHLHNLGPKAHVPEEFIDLGQLNVGHSATIKFAVHCDEDRAVVVTIGANAMKAAKVNGAEISQNDAGYLSMTPAELNRGENVIELKLTADRKTHVRAFWCLLNPGTEEQFRRPERIVASDAPVLGSQLVYRGKFCNGESISSGQLQVSLAAVTTVSLDGKTIGRLGGFDPYRLMMRALKYDLPAMNAGEHELAIEVLDPGSIAPALVDLLAIDSRGQRIVCMSDATWQVTRDNGTAMPVQLDSGQDTGGAVWHLYRRAHPLPRTEWIEGKQPAVVMDLAASPIGSSAIVQWFEWTIPSGATVMRLALEWPADARLWIEGEEYSIAANGDVELQGTERPVRLAVLRIESVHLAGGCFGAPVRYEFQSGTLACGSWLNGGLRSYSGAIRMKQTFEFQGDPTDAALDLGLVRGTVEAHLNGQSLGERFCSPYRFDLKNDLRRGENELELIVTNTLANFLSTWSPTRSWSPDQFECGVFGPVRICSG